MFMPTSILAMWFRGLFSIVLIGAGITLLSLWYNNRETVVVEKVELRPVQDRPGDGPQVIPKTERIRIVSWHFGLNWESAYLVLGILLLTWSVGGGWFVNPRLWRRKGDDDPKALPGEPRKVRQADGTDLHVELFGPADAPPMVCVHGWGLDNHEWYYLKKQFGANHRLILLDLAGLGQSDRPKDRDWALEKLAHQLKSVLALAGNKPAILVGHSIGVMIILTFCKLFPASLGTQVTGLVLAHGTYTNPVKTTSRAWLHTALQKPVLEPLCHLMIWLSPVVRVLNWLSFLNGSAHRSTDGQSFSGNETRGQLNFLASYVLTAPPDVLARGMLAMFEYDATEVLGRIPIPTLVLTGDMDTSCVPEASTHMATTIPKAELRVLSPARHCGVLERHEELHEAIQSFLSRTQIIAAPTASVGRTLQGEPATAEVRS